MKAKKGKVAQTGKKRKRETKQSAAQTKKVKVQTTV
jgi:hypothetical protein